LSSATKQTSQRRAPSLFPRRRRTATPGIGVRAAFELLAARCMAALAPALALALGLPAEAGKAATGKCC
jgi:hypothetical protein